MKKSKYFVNRRLIEKEISFIPGKRGISPPSALTKKGSLASLTLFAMTDSVLQLAVKAGNRAFAAIDY